MIVEDEITTAWAIEETLVDAGFTVCGKALDYNSAFGIMRQESPDLALIDINLGSQPDGIATAGKLIRIKWIPVIYLTGNTELQSYQKAKATHPPAFLHKPFRARELATQIDLAISNFYQGTIPIGANLSNDLYIWDGRKHTCIKCNEIIFFRADGMYTEI